jgi:uncharacterized protein DUF5989
MSKADFSKAASEKREGFLKGFIGFLRANKKWWIIPIVVVMLLLGVIVVLGGTGAAPFIYTLF